MSEDSQPLPEPEALIIPIPTPALGPSAPPQDAIGTNGGTQGHPPTNLDPGAESGVPDVCGAAPVAPPAPQAHPQMQGAASPVIGPDEWLRPLVKVNGKVHPMKPKTPAQVAEFAALWRNGTYSLAQIAGCYRASERTVQNWRAQFGLPPRDELLKLQAKGATVADAATAMVKAQSAAPAADGLVMPPGFGDRHDPLKDPEIAKGMAEVLDLARAITTHSDLRPLRRRVMRLAILIAAKTPQEITFEAMGKSLLYTEKVEATLPKGEPDSMLLRREAGTKLMTELKSVLNAEEQAALAKIMTAGAARLLARVRARPAAPGDPPGTPPERNGKTQPRLEP